jgi:hypothetical protein
MVCQLQIRDAEARPAAVTPASGIRNPKATLLVLAPTSAQAGIVPPDLWVGAPHGDARRCMPFTMRVSACAGLVMVRVVVTLIERGLVTERAPLTGIW